MTISIVGVGGGRVTSKDESLLDRATGELSIAQDAFYKPNDPGIHKVSGRTAFNGSAEASTIIGGRFIEFDGGTNLFVVGVGTTYRKADAGTILCDTDVLGLVEASVLQTAISVSSETDRRIFAHGFGAVVNASWGSQAMTAAVMVPNVVERFGLRHEGGGAESLWRNGAEVDTDTGSDVADALGAEINIGGFSTAGSRPLFGHIRNIRIYDHALSDREMAVA